jgi:hypothetical protein
MTNTPEPGANRPIPTLDVDAIIHSYEQRQRRRAELRPANKAALFEVLAGAGITAVLVTFDGYGDSGQIESIDAQSAEGEVSLPDIGVEIAVARYDEDEPERRCLPLRQAIEELAYASLGELHGGWENNEGAYGEFVFDTAKRSITLDYHERYTATEDFTHEL